MTCLVTEFAGNKYLYPFVLEVKLSIENERRYISGFVFALTLKSERINRNMNEDKLDLVGAERAWIQNHDWLSSVIKHDIGEEENANKRRCSLR